MTISRAMRRVSSYKETKDDFPSPPWVARAFIELVMCGGERRRIAALGNRTIHEPACGRGHMLRTLQEYCNKVRGSDIVNYGRNPVLNYLDGPCPVTDFKITNPPFKLAEPFFHKMYAESRLGVGLLVRTLWLENAGRYERIFTRTPPTSITVLSERMSAAQGRVVRKNQPFMSHTWFWWDKRVPLGQTVCNWFPPDTQQKFERDEDYE